MTTTKDKTNEVLAHRDAMVDVFGEITQDAMLLGFQPVNVSLSRYSSGEFHVSVQLPGQDVAAVDTLASSYNFPPETRDGWSGNYTRAGRLDVDGFRVHLTVYCGRPKLPTFPAGYAPQAVEA